MDIDVQELRKITLSTVPEDQAFWVCRGDKVHNLKDLANCIESLSPDQFRYHVDDAKKTTHFSAWIAQTFHNPLLARDVDLEPNLSNQTQLVKTIRDHINWLEHTNEQIIRA